MSSYLPRPRDFQFQHAVAPFVSGEGLPFADVFSAADVTRIVAKHPIRLGRRDWSLWTPGRTSFAREDRFAAANRYPEPSHR